MVKLLSRRPFSYYQSLQFPNLEIGVQKEKEIGLLYFGYWETD
jgi:hypothetical protein